MFVDCGGVTEFGAICLFVCVDQQLNNSLEELDLARNKLTDEFTADDNFIHLGKLRKLSLSAESFSEKGIAAIALLIQVHFSLLPFHSSEFPFVEFVYLLPQAILLSQWRYNYEKKMMIVVVVGCCRGVKLFGVSIYGATTWVQVVADFCWRE